VRVTPECITVKTLKHSSRVAGELGVQDLRRAAVEVVVGAGLRHRRGGRRRGGDRHVGRAALGLPVAAADGEQAGQ
jgi:hypothetical protein